MITACALLALLVTSAFILILTGEAAAALGRMLGMATAAGLVWSGLKWPLLLAIAAVLVLIVFRNGPPGTRSLRRALPGGILAVALWMLTSAGFAFYTSHAGTYNRLYGSLAGIVVFLVWLWVTNLSLLAGAQFNAELAREDPDDGEGRSDGARVVGPRSPVDAPASAFTRSAAEVASPRSFPGSARTAGTRRSCSVPARDCRRCTRCFR